MLDVDNLSVVFELAHETIPAISNMTFSLPAGGRLALMGESGCGKTVLALSILGLLPRTARVGGTILFRGIDLTIAANARVVRGKDIAVSWSNAETYFDPVATIGDQIAEAYLIHHPRKREQRPRQSDRPDGQAQLLRSGAGVSSFPHQLSGGMNQRAMIAMSLVNDPALVIVDEPTRGLDDRNRDMVVDTLLVPESVGMLLITHDVGLARTVADSVMVMRGGIILEKAARDAFFALPAHPYSRQLVDAEM